MDFRSAYDSDISIQRREHDEYLQQREEENKKDIESRQDFSKFCRRIYNGRRFFRKAYTAREKMGLTAWTHAYEYDCNDRLWLATKGFEARGRFGANSGDIVFVPEDADFDVISCDHTTVIDLRPDKLKEAWFIPAYRNTV